ncbi:MAG: cation:proton antiporter, partial [Longimicrobiales bacterium]
MAARAQPSRAARIGTRFVIAIALLGALTAMRALRQAGGIRDIAGAAFSADSAMAGGFLFLFAFLLGGIAQELRLPKITGYLLGGMLVGPELLASVSADNIADLSIVNGFAIGIIAFVAGAELRPQLLRERGRTIVRILVVEIGVVFFVLAIGSLLLRAYI